MQQLRYEEEIRKLDDVPIEEAEVSDAELQLAEQIVEQISSDEFRPEQYTDEARGRMREIIARKVEGQEITAAADEEPQAQIIDLMEALKSSLATEAEAAAESAPSKKTRRKAARAKKSATGKARAKRAKK